MSVNAKVLFESAFAPTVETTVYPAAARTLIDKFTGTNQLGGGPYTLTVKLVPAAGTAGAGHTIVVKSIAVAETYTFPELVGHVLEVGDFISVICGTASAVVIRASGRQVT